MSDTVETTAETDGSILVPKGKAGEIKYSVSFQPEITAPVTKGQVVGKITCKLGDEVVKEYNICAKNSVSEITFGSAFRLLVKYLLKML